MKIVNELFEIIQNPDLEKGCLVPEQIVVAHHDEVPAVEEQSHMEVVAIYPNGGKDLCRVIDVPASPAVPAWDEYEEVMRYVTFTQAELNQSRITTLKAKLDATDYVVIKIAEGAAEPCEYEAVLRDRAEWRKEINRLEAMSQNDPYPAFECSSS